MAKKFEIDSLDQLPLILTDNAPGAIQNGRNVKAGYARGVGIEFGNLSQLCADDPIMRQAFAAMNGRTIVSTKNLINIFLIMRYSTFSPVGNIVEFGSYKGGSAIFMAAVARLCGMKHKIYALDTFEGMPPADDSLDNHTEGDFNDSDYDGLLRLKEQMGLDNLIIIKGPFDQTVDQIPENDRRVVLAHVDCDIYDSVKFSLNWCKDHMVDGGYIICDDPLAPTCLGAMQACEEDLVRSGASAEQVAPHLVYRWPVLAHKSV